MGRTLLAVAAVLAFLAALVAYVTGSDRVAGGLTLAGLVAISFLILVSVAEQPPTAR